MSPPSRVCKHCGRLNSASETVCSRCGARFPGPLLSNALELAESLLGRESPMVRFYLGLCVLVFTFAAFGGGQVRLISSPLMSEAYRWGALYPLLIPQEPWRLLSAMFVHFGLLHLGMNMSALVSLGRGLEQALGSTRFIIVFVGTGLLGFALSVAWSLYGSGAMAPTAGASGGLFGLVGFEIGYLYRRGDPRWKQAFMRALAVGVLIGVFMSVNNAAHAGGAFFGAALGYASFKEALWRKYATLWNALAALLVVASLGSIALCNMSDFWRVQRAVEIQRGIVTE